ncbi:hypothetical protein JOB18_007357 [Solea senegalensis]|uniref:Uncharacterized protein n=1 Tax=Solea senegalensis TaxID=28829 RepID=A0AAV6QZ85_SOLSE|nr:hypothetical protein JOB18_007357 [Solea senegalensis]
MFVVSINPKCWTHHSHRMFPRDVQAEGRRAWKQETPVWDSCLWDDCDGAIGRQTFWLQCTFSCKYNYLQLTAQQRNPIGVLYIYCTIPNRAEILSSDHVFVT